MSSCSKLAVESLKLKAVKIVEIGGGYQLYCAPLLRTADGNSARLHLADGGWVSGTAIRDDSGERDGGSPDGRWVAFTSDESGSRSVPRFVSEAGAADLMSLGGGVHPCGAGTERSCTTGRMGRSWPRSSVRGGAMRRLPLPPGPCCSARRTSWDSIPCTTCRRTENVHHSRAAIAD